MNQEAFKTKMKTIFYNMDIKNNICVDCGKKKSMDYASINNGIIICSECAKEHEKLGYNISFLRSLGDKWDDYLFNYIKAGGNSRFIQFCKDYKVDKGNTNIIQKYKSKGLTYYRDIIRSEVLGYDPPDNINVNKAYEEEPEIPDNYPEFKKYSFVKHVNMNYLEKNFYKKKEEKIEEDEGIVGMIGGLWGSVKKKIGDEAGDIMKKVTEIDYSGVKEKGASIFGYFFGNDEENKNTIKENENVNNKNNEEEKKNKNENGNKKEEGNIFQNIFGVNIKNYFQSDKDKTETKEKEIKNRESQIQEKEKIENINKDIDKKEEKNKIIENKEEIKNEKEDIKEKIIENKEEIKNDIEIIKNNKEEIEIEDKKDNTINIQNNKNENVEVTKINEIKCNEEKEQENLIENDKNENSNNDIENNIINEKNGESNDKENEKENDKENDKENEKENDKETNKNVESVENAENVENVENVENIENIGNIEKIENIDIENLGNIKNVENIEKNNVKNENCLKNKNDEDIEELLKDNTFGNDNSKMNNEEKDELEKMLQE